MIPKVAKAWHRISAMRPEIDLCRTPGVPVIYTQHVLSDHFDMAPPETAPRPAADLATASRTESRT